MFRKYSVLTAFTLLIVLLLPCVSVSAEKTVRRDLLGENTVYTAILYDSMNGLPTSEANAIVQSDDGFIWIGGYSGLTRYDGTEFYHFDSKSGISSVFSLCTDSKGRIWIGTNENGVACFDHGDIRSYGRSDQMHSYSVRSMTEDAAGNIIIATTQGLAYAGTDNEIHMIDDPIINLQYVTTVVRSGKLVYGLTLDGSVFVIDRLRISAYYDHDRFVMPDSEEIINAIYPDPENESILYFGTSGSGLMTVDISNGFSIMRRKELGELRNVKAVFKNKSIIWIACTNGIGYIDENDAFNEVTDLPMNNSIGHIMSDHEGNLWFTSTRQGVMKLVPDRFTDISKFAGLEQMVVNSTCVNGNELYIATDEGLVILDNKNYARIENDLTKMLHDVRIRCIKNDSKGRMWFCTHGETGLICYDPQTGECVSYNEENGLDAVRVRAVLELQDGSMAAATGNGVFIIKDGIVTEHYGQGEGISNTEILSIAEGQDGTLYLGSDGDGIYVVESDDRVRRLGFEDGLTSGVIMRIKWDSEREMFWIITSNSIQYLKDGEIKQVTNFPYSNNLDICFDKNGGAWVLSSNGVYITHADDLLTENDLDYSFYNTRSGLPCITTSNSRSFLDDDGKLYISGTTGCCMVDINSSADNNESIKLIVPTIEIDDKTVVVHEGETVSVPAGSKRLSIDAFAITYTLNNPRIVYYLEGFDKNPIHTTKQEMKNVSYTNLDGGKYVFHLQVIDDRTGEVKKSVTVPIVKESSPYENLLFWIILMVIVIAAITVFMWTQFNKRTAALEKEREEDRQFITQIMHTFAKCVDMRDTQNQGHSFRVAYYTKMLAEKLAWKRGYTEDQVHEFYNIALLHDIGKISIPDAILNKPSRLDDEEFKIMKSHAEKGEALLKDVTVVENLAVGAGCHHERIDGRGYPRGLKGDDIPEVARVIAVADTFDAMYSTRPYRKQMLLSDVMNEIRRISGSQLDPEVTEALEELYEEGSLDKSKVDEIVFGITASKTDAEEEKRKRKEDIARRSKEFHDFLGLSADEPEDEQDKDDKKEETEQS